LSPRSIPTVTPELGVIFDFITEGSLPENVRSLTLPSHLILFSGFSF
jgi:hypothetical protein